jgi:hypothetical protein
VLLGEGLEGTSRALRKARPRSKRVSYEANFGEVLYLVMEATKDSFVQGPLHPPLRRSARPSAHPLTLPALVLTAPGSWLARGSLRSIKEINDTRRITDASRGDDPDYRDPDS